MSRTIRIPPTPPEQGPRPAGKPDPANAALLASVAGEEDPGAAVDAPVPPPRAPLIEKGEGSPPAGAQPSAARRDRGP